MSSKNIKPDILTSADYYPPGVYSSLLSWYRDLHVDVDELGPDFIPISATRRNPQPFIVGVLPPAVAITGRLLDRSAPVADLDPTVAEVGVAGGGSGNPIPAYGGGQSAGERVAAIANAMNGVSQRKNLEKYVNFLMTPGDRVNDATTRQMVAYYTEPWNYSCALFAAGCLRAAGLSEPELDRTYGGGNVGSAFENLKNVGRRYGAWIEGTAQELPDIGDMVIQGKVIGKIQREDHTSVLTEKPVEGQPTHTMNGGQQPQGEWKWLSRVAEGPSDDTKWTAISSWKTLAPGGVGTGTTQPVGIAILANGLKGPTADGPDPDTGGLGFGTGDLSWHRARGRWTVNNPKSGVKDIVGWLDVSKLPIPGTAPPPAPWKDKGADAAAAAAKDRAKTSGGSGVNSGNIGLELLKAQHKFIQEAQQALAKMQATPPLRMMVNPRSFDVKGTKIVSDGGWGRNGHIIEHWGDEQDVISASGRVAGFYALDATNNSGAPGLTRTARNFSAAWQNFQSLYMLYRNNGAMYLSDYRGNDEKNLALVGTIYIFYDGILYLGSFSNFNISEEETAPHTTEYSFEFNVRAAFLLDTTTEDVTVDGNVFNYGAPGFFQGVGGSTQLLPTSSAVTSGATASSPTTATSAGPTGPTLTMTPALAAALDGGSKGGG